MAAMAFPSGVFMVRPLLFLLALVFSSLVSGQAVLPPAASLSQGDAAAIPAANRMDSPLAIPPMAITVQQKAAAQLTYALLSNGAYAYAPRPDSKALEADVFERYVYSLDVERLFLTQEDIAAMGQDKASLGKALRGEDLSPVLNIYRRWNVAALKRLLYAKSLLAGGFDFTVKESWTVRTRTSKWPRDMKESNNLWRMYVKNDWLRLRLAGKDDADIRKILTRRYDRLLGNLHRTSSAEAIEGFLDSYGLSLDPHTDYMAPIDAATFASSMSLSLEGVGASLQMRDSNVEIQDMVPNSPAARSGKIKVGDRIVGVGQGSDGPMIDVVGWRLDEVVGLVRGKGGSQVRLSLMPGDESALAHEVVLTREKIKLEDMSAKKKVLEVDGHKVGVIQLPGFYLDFAARQAGQRDAKSAAADVKRLLNELKDDNVESVVVDLRGNGGGSLDEAVELTGLFIDVGPVVQVKSNTGKITVSGDDRSGVAWAGPLAVLVDRNSASASEIFAAAIQDYGRGLIVGEETWGKGTVQTLVDLDRVTKEPGNNLGQVKLTIAQFFRITGRTTQHDGVTPDIGFPATPDGDKGGEKDNDNALKATTIAAVLYTPAGHLSSLFPALKANHEKRMKTVPQLRWWMEDVRDFRKDRDDPLVTLNEADRRSERDRSRIRMEQRDEERRKLGMKVVERKADDGLYASERAPAPAKPKPSLAQPLPAAVPLDSKKAPAGDSDPLLLESARILTDAVSQNRGKLVLH